MFDFKILFAIIFIIISDENVNQVFSQIHVRVAYLFLYLRSRYICYRKRTVTVPWPYRMLAHRHAATSLYNLSQLAIMLHRVRHLTCERAWFCLVLFRCLHCVCHFGTDFGFKNILILFWIGRLVFSLFYLRNYSEVICQHGNLSSSGTLLIQTIENSIY
jgi:hypothetical protein